MAQWFPKVGVLEAGGWNTHQFIQTEFFADFGNYDVRLDVPGGCVVGATGDRHPAVQNAGRHAHGTASRRRTCTTSPGPPRHTSPYITTASRTPACRQWTSSCCCCPITRRCATRYLRRTKDTLRLYGEWFHPYAWHRITVVDPPWDARSTGGMEYPMFVTGESRWPTLAVNRLAEANTLHEVGHMWWQGAVANNEFEDSWLDEAMNTYSHKRILEELYRPTSSRSATSTTSCRSAFLDLPRAQTTHGADPLRRPALGADVRVDRNTFLPLRRAHLLPAVLHQGRLALVTLERYLGWETDAPRPGHLRAALSGSSTRSRKTSSPSPTK